MKFTGTILDFYDDHGATIKESYASLEDIPSTIKNASFIEKEKLAQDDFALVAISEGNHYPKYPTYDQGSTALSLLYFDKHAHKLPAKAQQVAAHFLTKAAMRENLLPSEELIKKASEVYNSNIVDVTDMEQATQIIKQADTAWGVVHKGKNYFPLSTEHQIAQAQEYWLEKQAHMPPAIRREFAVNIVNRSDTASLPVPLALKIAASESYGPETQLDNALALRREVLPYETEAQTQLQKIASTKFKISADTYAKNLAEFDIKHGIESLWGRNIPDPFQSTYGISKVAKVLWEDGADRLTEEALLLLATEHVGDFDELFSDDIVSGFDLDPLGTFNKLPKRLKRRVARLAEDLRFSGKSEAQGLYGDR